MSKINYWYNRLFTNRVMLWSVRHGLWERPLYRGYTSNVYEAGWFSRANVSLWYRPTGGVDCLPYIRKVSALGVQCMENYGAPRREGF